MASATRDSAAVPNWTVVSQKADMGLPPPVGPAEAITLPEASKARYLLARSSAGGRTLIVVVGSDDGNVSAWPTNWNDRWIRMVSRSSAPFTVLAGNLELSIRVTAWVGGTTRSIVTR